MPFVGSRQDCKGAWAAGRQSQALACTHASLGIGTVLCSPPPRPRSACPTWQAWRPHGPSLTIASPPSRPPCCTRPPAGFRGPSAPGQSPGSVGGLWWPAGWGSLPAGHGAGTHHGARGWDPPRGPALSVGEGAPTFPLPAHSPGLGCHECLSLPSWVMLISQTWKLRPGCQMGFQGWSGMEQDSQGGHTLRSQGRDWSLFSPLPLLWSLRGQ